MTVRIDGSCCPPHQVRVVALFFGGSEMTRPVYFYTGGSSRPPTVSKDEDGRGGSSSKS